jgi:Ala-tRNA(Pro) deacylase
MVYKSDDLLARLAALGVAAETRSHEPVLTVDAMMAICGDLPGAHTKNLFLRDAKRTYFLVSMLHDALLDLKTLRHRIGAKGGLSFAKLEALDEKLGVISGAVSPFAAINDDEGVVKVCLQDELMRQSLVNWHPLTNDRSTAIRPDDMVLFLEAIGHTPMVFGLTA